MKPISWRSLSIPIAAMAAVIVLSNVLVQHAINDWLTWGAFTYPFAFLVTDLTNRWFGPARTRLPMARALGRRAGPAARLAVAPRRVRRRRARWPPATAPCGSAPTTPGGACSTA